MCGIVYCNDLKGLNVSDRIIHLYKNQRNRGIRGFGFYLPKEDVLYHNTVERSTLRKLKRLRSSEIMFHHRMPTSTSNIMVGCHPYSTKKNKSKFRHQYVMVHNGVLTNDLTLHFDHVKDYNIKYVSEHKVGSVIKYNDSEALLYDLALYLDGKQTTLKARGSIAFVVIEKNSTGRPIKMHFGRNDGNPLKLNHKPGQLLHLSSEGKGKLIEPDMLYTFDYKTQQITKKALTIQRFAPVTTTYSGTPSRNAPSYPSRNPDFTDHRDWVGANQQFLGTGRTRIDDKLAEVNALTVPDDPAEALAKVKRLDQYVSDPAMCGTSGFYDLAGNFYDWEYYGELSAVAYSGEEKTEVDIADAVTSYVDAVWRSAHDSEDCLAIATKHKQNAEDKLTKLLFKEQQLTQDHKPVSAGLKAKIAQIEDHISVIELALEEFEEDIEIETQAERGEGHDSLKSLQD